MDRLSAVVALLVVACAGSEGGESPPPASRSRVNAVAAKKKEPVAAADIDGFCDHRDKGDGAPKLAWPELRTPAAAAKGPRWINVWATWCAPCVAELPRLVEWKAEISKQVDFELLFVSADGEPTEVAGFAKEHPQVQGTLELVDGAALTPWLQGFGVQDAGRLPVHMFVDGQDRIRCIRMSEVGPDDRDTVTQLLASLE